MVTAHTPITTNIKHLSKKTFAPRTFFCDSLNNVFPYGDNKLPV